MDISNIERNIIEVYRDTLIGTRDIIEQIEEVQKSFVPVQKSFVLVHIEYNAIGLRQYVVLAVPQITGGVLGMRKRQ